MIADSPGTSGSGPLARVLVPAGMLGAGFAPETVERGIRLGANAIALDGGSTDSGPYYLGAAEPKTTGAAVLRDLRVLVPAARRAGIPLVIGSCGTSGTDAGVDWVAGLVRQVAAEESISLRLGLVYSEQDAVELARRFSRGEFNALEPALALSAEVLNSCEHIVGVMGHEPLVAAIEAGADVVLGGRATDTAVLAAVPLMRGCPPGPTWHAAKVAECGGMCTTDPRAGGVLITIDAAGFTVESLAEQARCTTTSVAAHLLYENADPYRMREPAGTLDTTGARYEALDGRTVRVSGSRFVDEPYTMKLEGSAIVGYQAISLSGIRDPEILGSIGLWVQTLEAFLHDGIARTFGLGSEEYQIELRCYGWNAVLGDIDPEERPPREVGVILVVTCPGQETANQIAKYANTYMLHMPLPDMEHLPSFAFMSSPAEIERGPMYEFVLNHSVGLRDPCELVRTVIEDVGAPR